MRASELKFELEACLKAIDARNPALNALVAVDAEGARAAAQASAARIARAGALGPLDGMPVAIKDNIDVAGLPAAAGMGARRGRRPGTDAHCVERLRAHGAVILGKAHMDEAALGALGDNLFFGRCHNPMREGYTPGGSSSGSAAAVAAGFCRAALGSDTLGSVRIPAAYCGVVGYLPAMGSIDPAGVFPLAPRFDRVGVLARTVGDAALVAGAISNSRIAVEKRAATIGQVRGLEGLVPAPILSAMEAAARKLAEAGHRMTEVPLALDWSAARRAAFLLIEVEAARIHVGLLEDPKAEISPGLRQALEYGRRAAPEKIERAERELERVRATMAAVLSSCEVLLLPTAPQTAFAFGTPVPSTQADLAAPASICGFPAISVPMGAVDGLPVGAQLVAHSDGLLLAAALHLE
jgi:aspartyl-tRNA(Asn)/glutamyl-tRNA(Gln) amidotransferase subunit A